MTEKPTLGPIALAVLGAVTGTAALSVGMYLPAFPAIAAEFGVMGADIQVTMSTFLAGFAIGQLLYGPLSDGLGRRPVILTFLALYALASAACAMASGVDSLIWLRLMQGMAGASGSVLGRAVVADVYQGPRLAKALSTLMLILSVSPMAGPFLGSFVLDIWGWRAIFAVLAAYAGILCLVLAGFVPESLPRERRNSIRPFDIAQVFLANMRHRRAMGYVLCAGFAFAGMFAYISATPSLYIERYGLSPFVYAVFFATNVVGMSLTTLLNGRLAERVEKDRLLFFYTLVLLFGAGGLVVGAIFEWGGVWSLAIPLFFYVGSISAIAANSIVGTMQFFSRTAGSASSVFGLFQFSLGSLAGIIVAFFDDGSPLPMALVILACAVLSAASLRLTKP